MAKDPKKIYVIALKYSLKFYMPIHTKVLSKFLLTEEVPIELIIPEFNRRSLKTLFFDFFYIFKWLIRSKPYCVVTVGPKVGFLFSILSFVFNIKQIHWFTGQQWALNKIKYLSPSFISDFTINLLAYKTMTDSKEQAFFLKKNFFIRDILFESNGSINCVSKKLHLIGQKRIEKINSSGFKLDYPIKVGFLGRICVEKGLDIINQLADDKTLNRKFKFIIRGPSDLLISQRKNNNMAKTINLESSNLDYKEGFIENSEFFNLIDIFILPSKREGFGSVALEAQACGVPIICSDIYGLYSSVIDGYGGIHCRNISDYKTALEFIIDEKNYKKFCNNAYSFSQEFSEENFSYNLSKLYKKII